MILTGVTDPSPKVDVATAIINYAQIVVTIDPIELRPQSKIKCTVELIKHRS